MRRICASLVVVFACTAPSQEQQLPEAMMCTADTQTDPNHCGACGHVCPHIPGALSLCEAGACTFRCERGRDDCNADPSDGCEVELDSAAEHCGECANACAIPSGAAHLAPICMESTCAVSCEHDFGDCNANLADGCETDLRTDASSCGFCGNTCATGCANSACIGETPPCRLFDIDAARPVDVDVASDGDTFLLAWSDFDNGGLWIAPLDRHGRPSAAALRVADVESWWRFGLAYDGASFVLAWEDETARQLRAQRFDHAGASLGASLLVAEDANPNAVRVIGGGGDAMILFEGGFARWHSGAATPDPLGTIPGSSGAIAPTGVRLPDGWLIFWASERPMSTQLALNYAVLDNAGMSTGAGGEVDPSLSLGPGLPFDAVAVPGGALLAMQGTASFAGIPFLMTLEHDAAGRAASLPGGAPAWREPLATAQVRIFGVAGDANGAWLASVTQSDPQEPMQLTRLDPQGRATPLAVEVPISAGFYSRLASASNAEGVFVAWAWRSFSGGPDLTALDATFATHTGTLERPCE